MAKSKPPGRDGNVLELVPARGYEREAERGLPSPIRNIREHPIDTLLERNTIEGYHHQAAERFLRDWELSQIAGAKAAPLEPSVDGGRAGGLSDTQADAYHRVGRALTEIGRINKVIVLELVIGRKTLDQLAIVMRASGLRWPQKRYAGPRLCEALHVLAEHYGLATRRPQK